MKKNVFFLCFYIFAFLVIAANAFYLLINNAFVDISDVPEGEYKYSVISPDGNTELKVYVVKNHIGSAVRVSRIKNDKAENVFWQANSSDADVYWYDNHTVAINGIILDFAEGETFDSRNIRSIFNDGLMGWD